MIAGRRFVLWTPSRYLPIIDDKISIGHDMCGGPFPLDKKRAYTASITLLAPELGTSSAAQIVTFIYTPVTRP